jgi:proline iminopeptidase
LFPAIEFTRREWLPVGGAHRIYVEESGNPDGLPVLFIHGGPGSRSRPIHRRFFDPSLFRIVLFDQRGCGLSTPAGPSYDNTTAHLIEDIERIRSALGVDRWLLFGGSWGSTLSLAYAIAHPQAVKAMILRGVFLGSCTEVDWFLYGVRHFVPEAWAEFSAGANGDLQDYYHRQVQSADPAIALAAARRWSDFESRVMSPGEPLRGNADPADALVAKTGVQLHYMAKDFYLRPGELLDNLWQISHIPTIIVQGRLDMVSPPVTAAMVAEKLSKAQLCWVPQGGHDALQPAMSAALVAATTRMHGWLAKGAG